MQNHEHRLGRGTVNLLLLADIIEAADALHREAGEPTYNQRAHMHDCGTPSCALAHWYAYKGQSWLDGQVDEVLEEFEITPHESLLLFSGDGCGGARNAHEAASFIRGFAASRRAPRDPGTVPSPQVGCGMPARANAS